jgi:NAD(P)-dependent dehydrogenase (short-subunit alcohol dehydrogenase family)
MKAVQCLVAEAKKAYGKLDILVNNAGEIFLILEDCRASDRAKIFCSVPQFEVHA